MSPSRLRRGDEGDATEPVGRPRLGDETRFPEPARRPTRGGRGSSSRSAARWRSSEGMERAVTKADDAGRIVDRLVAVRAQHTDEGLPPGRRARPTRPGAPHHRGRPRGRSPRPRAREAVQAVGEDLGSEAIPPRRERHVDLAPRRAAVELGRATGTGAGPAARRWNSTSRSPPATSRSRWKAASDRPISAPAAAGRDRPGRLAPRRTRRASAGPVRPAGRGVERLVSVVIHAGTVSHVGANERLDGSSV